MKVEFTLYGKRVTIRYDETTHVGTARVEEAQRVTRHTRSVRERERGRVLT